MLISFRLVQLRRRCTVTSIVTCYMLTSVAVHLLHQVVRMFGNLYWCLCHRPQYPVTLNAAVFPLDKLIAAVSFVDLSFVQFFGDDFLRVLLLRYVFCYITLRLHKAFRVSSSNNNDINTTTTTNNNTIYEASFAELQRQYFCYY